MNEKLPWRNHSLRIKRAEITDRIFGDFSLEVFYQSHLTRCLWTVFWRKAGGDYWWKTEGYENMTMDPGSFLPAIAAAERAYHELLTALRSYHGKDAEK